MILPADTALLCTGRGVDGDVRAPGRVKFWLAVELGAVKAPGRTDDRRHAALRRETAEHAPSARSKPSGAGGPGTR